MMPEPLVLIHDWMPPEMFPRLAAEFPRCRFVDARAADVRDRLLKDANIIYGNPPAERLQDSSALDWIQLISAGVPADLCPLARTRGWTITSLAGLYGTTIAEHALCLMLLLNRNLHVAMRNQREGRWDRTVAHTMADLHGKTLAVVGLGNIGQNIARLARGLGMRVVGCRRTNRAVAAIDRLYPLSELHAMLAEADVVAVAAPLAPHTQGMLGPAEFSAMKRGAIYVNVSRGGIAQEKALLEALQSGHIAAAGLDVFAVEPLPADHPFWTMPQVIVSPHYSGETVNQGSFPSERFARNLASWLAGMEMEGLVNLDCGY